MMSYNEWASINSMSTSRADAMVRISTLSDSMLDHIIKVLKWSDNINRRKHLHDINTWFNKLRKIKLKPNNKPPKDEDLWEWLLYTHIENPKELSEWIDDNLTQYKQLPTLLTDEELFTVLESVYSDIIANWTNKNYRIEL